jgi:hypothetical protein
MLLAVIRVDRSRPPLSLSVGYKRAQQLSSLYQPRFSRCAIQPQKLFRLLEAIAEEEIKMASQERKRKIGISISLPNKKFSRNNIIATLDARR